MRKVLSGISLLALASICLQLSASADPWFDRWDRNRDGYWNWDEYRAAQMDWCSHHHRRCDDATMRREFEAYDHDHDGRVLATEVRGAHPWM